MTLNILTINKVQKFIAHKKKKKKLEDEQKNNEDSYEDSDHSKAERNITNVFLDAVKLAKEKAINETNNNIGNSDHGHNSSDSQRFSKDNSIQSNPKFINNSEEESIRSLMSINSKTERNIINHLRGAKIVPENSNMRLDRQDSKSTVKNSEQESNGNLVENSSLNLSPIINTFIKIPVESFEEVVKSNIINKYGHIDATKNYTVLNELSIGSYFGEISALTNLPVTASVHTASNTICARIHK